MSDISLTTAELAAFDQHWQTVERSVDGILAVYRDMTGDGRASREVAVSREVDLLCFAAALPQLVGVDDCAALLACAIARLARHEPQETR